MDGDTVQALIVETVTVSRNFSDEHGPCIGVTFGQDGVRDLHFSLSDDLARFLTRALLRKFDREDLADDV